jgi:hypothetical protein
VAKLVIAGVSLRFLWLTERDYLEEKREKKYKLIFRSGTIVFLILHIIFWETLSITWLSLYTGIIIIAKYGHLEQEKLAFTLTTLGLLACLVLAIGNIVMQDKNYESNIKAIGETVSVETSIDLVPVNKKAMVTNKIDKGYTFAYMSENGQKTGEFAPTESVKVHYIGANEQTRLIKIAETTPMLNFNFNPAREFTKESTRY